MSTPMLPAAAPATATTATAAEPAAGVPADDFLLMLGQLLGAPVTKAATKPVNAPAVSSDEASEAVEDAAALAGLPITLPMNAAATTASAKTSGLAEVTASMASPPRTPAANGMAVEQLVEGLVETSARENESTQPTNANPLQAQPLDATHLRAAASAVDPGSSRPLHHPVGTSAWADELGTRMLLMKEGGQHSASLRLSPEHLGPLEVRISVRDEQASVWFGSAHADTRAAIEQALPRLRELFESQGLALADAGVHHETPRGQPQPSTPSATPAGGQSEAETSPVPIAVKLGIVDEYV